MNDYINLYFASDDTVVSYEGIFTNSIDILIKADLAESSSGLELYARAVANYDVENTIISFNTTATSVLWRLALTQAGLDTAVWGDPLTIGTVSPGLSGQVSFWIQAKALDTERPSLDTTVILGISGDVTPIVT